MTASGVLPELSGAPSDLTVSTDAAAIGDAAAVVRAPVSPGKYAAAAHARTPGGGSVGSPWRGAASDDAGGVERQVARLLSAVESGNAVVATALIGQLEDTSGGAAGGGGGGHVLNRLAADGRVALVEAAQRNDERLVALLLESGASGSARDAKGCTALHVTTSAEVAARVLESVPQGGVAALVNARDHAGRSPLFGAVRTGGALLRLLLQFGARVSQTDDAGLDALAAAEAETPWSLTDETRMLVRAAAKEQASARGAAHQPLRAAAGAVARASGRILVPERDAWLRRGARGGSTEEAGGAAESKHGGAVPRRATSSGHADDEGDDDGGDDDVDDDGNVFESFVISTAEKRSVSSASLIMPASSAATSGPDVTDLPSPVAMRPPAHPLPTRSSREQDEDHPDFSLSEAEPTESGAEGGSGVGASGASAGAFDGSGVGDASHPELDAASVLSPKTGLMRELRSRASPAVAALREEDGAGSEAFTASDVNPDVDDGSMGRSSDGDADPGAIPTTEMSGAGWLWLHTGRSGVLCCASERWQEHFFVLDRDEAALHWYDREVVVDMPVNKRGLRPLGCIDTTKVFAVQPVVPQEPTGAPTQFTFTVCTSRRFTTMCAARQDEKRVWMEALTDVCCGEPPSRRRVAPLPPRVPQRAAPRTAPRLARRGGSGSGSGSSYGGGAARQTSAGGRGGGATRGAAYPAGARGGRGVGRRRS